MKTSSNRLDAALIKKVDDVLYKRCIEMCKIIVDFNNRKSVR